MNWLFEIFHSIIVRQIGVDNFSFNFLADVLVRWLYLIAIMLTFYAVTKQKPILKVTKYMTIVAGGVTIGILAINLIIELQNWQSYSSLTIFLTVLTQIFVWSGLFLSNRGKFQYEENSTTNWEAIASGSRLRPIALLQSCNEEDIDEDELDITYRLRGSPFVAPILDTWTIYKDIEGFPNKFVAVRRFGGNACLNRKSDLIIKDSLDEIRDIMEQEKKIRREAVHNEESTIIEIWI